MHVALYFTLRVRRFVILEEEQWIPWKSGWGRRMRNKKRGLRPLCGLTSPSSGQTCRNELEALLIKTNVSPRQHTKFNETTSCTEEEKSFIVSFRRNNRARQLQRHDSKSAKDEIGTPRKWVNNTLRGYLSQDFLGSPSSFKSCFYQAKKTTFFMQIE